MYARHLSVLQVVLELPFVASTERPGPDRLPEKGSGCSSNTNGYVEIGGERSVRHLSRWLTGGRATGNDPPAHGDKKIRVHPLLQVAET